MDWAVPVSVPVGPWQKVAVPFVSREPGRVQGGGWSELRVQLRSATRKVVVLRWSCGRTVAGAEGGTPHVGVESVAGAGAVGGA